MRTRASASRRRWCGRRRRSRTASRGTRPRAGLAPEELDRVYSELARLNAEYEAKHGFRFVVFVNGRSRRRSWRCSRRGSPIRASRSCGRPSTRCWRSPGPPPHPLLTPYLAVLPADRLAQLLDRDALAGVERQRLLQDQVLVAQQRERPVAVLHFDTEQPAEQADPVDDLERRTALDGTLDQEAMAAVEHRDQRIGFEAIRLRDGAVEGGALDLRQDDGGALVAVNVLVRLHEEPGIAASSVATSCWTVSSS